MARASSHENAMRREYSLGEIQMGYVLSGGVHMTRLAAPAQKAEHQQILILQLLHSVQVLLLLDRVKNQPSCPQELFPIDNSLLRLPR
jgi:hypothetical protein